MECHEHLEITVFALKVCWIFAVANDHRALKSNWPSTFPDVQVRLNFFLKAPFQHTVSQQRSSEHMEKAPSVWPSAGRDLYLRFVQCVSYIETSAKYTKQNHIFGFSETSCSPRHSKRMQATEKGRKKILHPK